MRAGHASEPAADSSPRPSATAVLRVVGSSKDETSTWLRNLPRGTLSAGLVDLRDVRRAVGHAALVGLFAAPCASGTPKTTSGPSIPAPGPPSSLERAFAGASRDTPKIYIGDLSTPWGGPLPPHASHQSGRDVDIGYARIHASDPWWVGASARTLDVVVEWRLLKALVTRTPVEVIFIDRAIQSLLKAHAQRAGEDARWLDGVFDLGRPRPQALVRHVPGHLDHMHVRFYSPRAQHVGHVVHDLLTKAARHSARE